ncbi:MAG: hypothetical protein R3258_03865 [Acidimicrobiia bacterium]|nr:hypothetical protein [Acidimicrobiia bacterium]
MTSADPGSFRDPASRIVFQDGRIIRLLDPSGLAAWQRLSSSRFHGRAVDEGRLIESSQIEHPPAGAAGAVEHPRLPMITYPFEWTFSMLKDAALLQLDLLADALGEGLTIKDATPYNIQFVAGRPMFIDIGSFQEYREGEPWIGYRQFTRQFLFPLMLRSWAGLRFQPFLRGDPEGPTAAEMRSLLPLWRRITPAGLMHVSLQARLEKKLSGASVRDDLARAGFSAQLILNNVKRLRDLVSSLQWNAGDTEWTGYVACKHVGRDRDEKASFLRQALSRGQVRRVLDLGTNDGYFSEIAHDAGAMAVAVDGDEGTLEESYRRLPGKAISIVLADLSNPSPSQGWAGVERRSLFSRSDPDLVIAYGLIHHLIYTSSIPPAAVVQWLRRFDSRVVLEFVSPDDEMVEVLTANKRVEELHEDRDEQGFRSILVDSFEILSETSLGSGSRVLFELQPR